jgi:hypothetical protein
MKLLLSLLLLPGLGLAAILPDALGAYQRATVSQPTLSNQPLWNEFGLRGSESAVYQNGTSKCTVTAYQFQDPTGAMAAFEWQRPANSTPAKVSTLAAETPGSLMLVHGNYLLVFVGYQPTLPELDQFALGLKNVEDSALPASHLPEPNRVPNSERYVLGPVGLKEFAPGIPPSVAAFHLGAEGELSTYHGPKGDVTLLVFNYPNQQIARQRIEEFGKIQGAVAKRSGPLVAISLNPPDPDLAENLLSNVRFQADVTLQEHIPTQRDNIGNLVINAFILIGILLCFTLVAGLAVGGVRVWMRHGKENPDADTLISLHLQ